MMDNQIPNNGKLMHDLKNVQQEKLALQSMLARAADELDHLAEADCSDDAKHAAEIIATRCRRASSV